MRKSCFLLFVSLIGAQAQQLASNCTASGVPVIVRTEGVTERLGDITLTCTAPAGREVTGNLAIFFSVPLTNRTLAASVLDAVLTIDTGTGAVISPAPALLSGTTALTFSGIRFTPSANGTAQLRITNVRGDVSRNPGTNIVAQVTGTSLGLPGTASVTVAVPQKGLRASSVSALVCTQVGSPLPESLTFSQFLAAGSAFSSIRISEGFTGAFEPRTRIVIRYANVPSDARLFVPNSIAGSNADQPTAAGDYGGVPSSGSYIAGSGTLLLGRVVNTDTNGAGGGVASVDGMSEVSVLSGSGLAVFEILDSDSATVESAQIPTFLTASRTPSARSVQIGREVFFGPLSTAGTTSPNLPIPRFAAVTPDNDCILRGDCANLIPRLLVPAADRLTFEVTENSTVLRGGRIYVQNAGGGTLRYTTLIDHKTGGTGWIRIAQESNAVYVLLTIPGLAPGLYTADVVIDGANAGIERIPVSLKVNAAAPAGPPRPTLSSITNGASFAPGPVAPGSLITLKGANLSGTNVGVTFDGVAARVLFTSADQINVEVPAELGARQSASILVTANGVAGEATNVALQAVAPGIFVPGILNQDNTINSAANPAQAGTFVQIFATGLLSATGQGVVTSKLHDGTSGRRLLAVPAPGFRALQQVNIQIPEYFPTMTTEVLLCSNLEGLNACSLPVKISVRQRM